MENSCHELQIQTMNFDGYNDIVPKYITVERRFNDLR